jgi:hypothetical protein
MFMENRKEIFRELKVEFKAVLREVAKLESAQISNMATDKEIEEELDFFESILHSYDTCFSILRGEKGIISQEKTQQLSKAIEALKEKWPTKRGSWERMAASVTVKSHDLWYEIPLQLPYLGRFHQFMEDPIEKAHSSDKQLDKLYNCIRDYAKREDLKRKRELMSDNPDVKREGREVQEKFKRVFSAASQENKRQKVAVKAEAKADRIKQ